MASGPFVLDQGRADPRLADLLAGYPAGLFDDRLYQSITWANDYTAGLVAATLADLGIADVPTDLDAAAACCRHRGFAGRFAPTLAWMGRFRQGAGSIERPPLDRLRAAGVAIDCGNSRSAALLEAAAAAHPPVARGEATGEDLLLGPATVPLWLDYFDNANPLYAANNRVAAIAARDRLAGRGNLRILELGAGAGSATEALLEELDARGGGGGIERYVVTEPSAFFRRRGQRRLAVRWPVLTFKSLDIDRPWSDQGLSDCRFDLVFAVNVLHVATDLAFTLAEIKASLDPGGWLVAGECLRPFAAHPVWIEYIFRLLESFNRQHPAEEGMTDIGFLTAEAWSLLVQRAGFADIQIVPDHRRIRTILPQFLVGAVCAQGSPAIEGGL